MKKYRFIILSLTILLFLNSYQKTEAEKDADLIPFEVLKNWQIPPGGIGMIILVSEKATKDEVMKLAVKLRERYIHKYKGKGGIYIDIFDSKEAWLNRDNPKYPEAKFDRSWLVNINVNPYTGYDKIEWTAIGRKY
jgi:hypothetical protein